MAAPGEMVLRQRFCLGSECCAPSFCVPAEIAASATVASPAGSKPDSSAALRQPATSTESGRTARSSRPAAAVPSAPGASARDGSGFPFDRWPGIIRMWAGGSNPHRSSRPILRRFTPSLAGDASGRLDVLPGLWPQRAIHGSVSTHSTTKVSQSMISPEIRAQIRRYFYAEHWKIGTIARELGVHPDAVRNAIEAQRFNAQPLRTSLADPYLAFIRQTLDQHPRLRATRMYQMVRDRGYTGSVVQLRRAVARLRPQIHEPFLRLETFPGEQAQVDWAHFGH